MWAVEQNSNMDCREKDRKISKCVKITQYLGLGTLNLMFDVRRLNQSMTSALKKLIHHQYSDLHLESNAGSSLLFFTLIC